MYSLCIEKTLEGFDFTWELWVYEVVWFSDVVPDVDNTVQDCAMESTWVRDVWLWCFKFLLEYPALDGC